jgi:hypothetical protein
LIHRNYTRSNSIISAIGTDNYQNRLWERKMKFISAKNVALLVAAGLISSTGVAMAADTPAPTTTPTAAPTAKVHTPNPAVVAYKAAIATYHSGRVAADTTAKSAIDAAKATRDAAIAAATTPEAKSAARTAFKSAVTSAKATHDAAIAALGAKPTPPVKATK